MFALHATLGIVFSLCGAPFGASKINTRAAFTLSHKPKVFGKLGRFPQSVVCGRAVISSSAILHSAFCKSVVSPFS